MNLPTEIQFQIMDYLYGDPYEMKWRVLHQIRYKRLMGEFWVYQGCFENDLHGDEDFEWNLTPQWIVWGLKIDGLFLDIADETLYSLPRLVDENGDSCREFLRTVYANRYWYEVL